MGTEMYVTSYTLQYSDNGTHWKDYTDDEDYPYKVRPRWKLELLNAPAGREKKELKRNKSL